MGWRQGERIIVGGCVLLCLSPPSLIEVCLLHLQVQSSELHQSWEPSAQRSRPAPPDSVQAWLLQPAHTQTSTCCPAIEPLATEWRGVAASCLRISLLWWQTWAERSSFWPQQPVETFSKREDGEDAAALAQLCGPFSRGFHLWDGPLCPLSAPQEQRWVALVVHWLLMMKSFCVFGRCNLWCWWEFYKDIYSFSFKNDISPVVHCWHWRVLSAKRIPSSPWIERSRNKIINGKLEGFATTWDNHLLQNMLASVS